MSVIANYIFPIKLFSVINVLFLTPKRPYVSQFSTRAAVEQQQSRRRPLAPPPSRPAPTFGINSRAAAAAEQKAPSGPATVSPRPIRRCALSFDAAPLAPPL